MALPSTMEEQIEDIMDRDISYRQLHQPVVVKDLVSGINIKVPFSSLTNKYRDFLSKIIIEVDFDDRTTAYYKYKPKRLSEDLYGTTELWSDLLILNNYISITEFIPTRVKAYDPTLLKEYLNEILILENLID